MRYIHVRWIHNKSDVPAEIYSEIDNNRMETRKVEIYTNGKGGYADKTNEVNGTFLAIEPIPEIWEIEKDKQFVVREISLTEFEDIWSRLQ